jgi:polysaccharide deacetylase 2 family uncharacterized protein YibQ
MTKRYITSISLIVFLFILVFIFYNTFVRPKVQVAFVIDDWGYSKKNLELLFQIHRPITIAVLPNLNYSKEIAEEVGQNGRLHDIILHLPLESESNATPELNTIRCSMGKEKIVSILKKDIESLPGIIGVSNHQGSRATKDKNTMKVIFTELKKRKLFFLDSMTSPKSVCKDIAHNTGLRFARRDVFLDLTDKKDSKLFKSHIKKQIEELIDIAKKEGSAIGIGHNNRITLEVLRDAILELERQRIRIVPLKRLVK